MCEQIWHLTMYHVSQAEADWSHLSASVSDQQRTVVLSVTDGEELVRTVQDISRMPFTEFVSLYTVGSHHMLITCSLSVPQAWPQESLAQILHKFCFKHNMGQTQNQCEAGQR